MLIPNIESYHNRKLAADRQEGGIRVNSSLDRQPNEDSENPSISVITVVYNGEKEIEETLLSVLNQSYHNIEYIVVDGASTDRTLDIIKKYGDRINYWISEPDLGLYDAMNKAISLATGLLVGIVNVGDKFTPDAVKTVVTEYQKQKTLKVYSGDCKMFLNNNKDKWVLYSGHCNLPDRMLPHGATFVPLSAYAQYGLHDTSLKIAADYDLMSRLYKESVPFFHIPTTIAVASAPGVSIDNHYTTYLECLIVRFRHHPSILRSLLITGVEFTKVTIRIVLERLHLWYLVEDMKNGTVLR